MTKKSQKTKNTRIVERDVRMMKKIHDCGGMMSLNQIDHAFFTGKGGSWVRERLNSMCNMRLLYAPDDKHKHEVPMGDHIYMLSKEGASTIAGQQGKTLHQLDWKPWNRWKIIWHDLRINDFRLNIEKECEHFSKNGYELYDWIPEHNFRSDFDVVQLNKPIAGRKKKGIQPDSVFIVRRPLPQDVSKLELSLFIFEFDTGTERMQRFVQEKVIPGIIWIQSPEFKARFGHNYGRWLVVANCGDKKLKRFQKETTKAGGGKLFYFTTLSKVERATQLNRKDKKKGEWTPEKLLTSPIWYLAESDEPVPLFPLDS